MIPDGFRNVVDLPQIKKTRDLYFAAGQRVNGFTININVVRARAQGLGNIANATRIELQGIKRATPSTRVGAVKSTEIAGGPARVVDNISGPKGKMLAHRQVYFEHRGWIYVISYAALPSTFHLGVKGLGQIVTAWQWTGAAASARSASVRVPARSPRASARARFTSTFGDFKTVIPAGFRNVLGSPQAPNTGFAYFAVGRRAKGYTTTINVVRVEFEGLGNLDRATRIELSGIKRSVPTARIGAVKRAKVAGEPARVVDDFVPKGKQQLVHHQVYFAHGGQLYVLTYSALRSTFHLGAKGLGQVLSKWQWT